MREHSGTRSQSPSISLAIVHSPHWFVEAAAEHKLTPRWRVTNQKDIALGISTKNYLQIQKHYISGSKKPVIGIEEEEEKEVVVVVVVVVVHGICYISACSPSFIQDHLGLHVGSHLGFHLGFHSGFHLGAHLGLYLGLHVGFHLEGFIEGYI